MPSLLASELVSAPSLASTTDAILGELSRQFASSNGRRLSRGSNGYRTPGSAMRITKPSSANNSPQSALSHSRRRTMMNDGLHARLHLAHPIETSYLPAHSTEMAFDHINDPVKRTPRPMSWHPSPQHVQHLPFPQLHQQQPLMQYPFPSYQETDLYNNFQQLPPTPAAYSGYNSPASASAFSPLSLPYSNLEYPQYVSPPTWTAAAPAEISQSTTSSNLDSTERLSVAIQQQLPRLSGSSGSSSDWDSFVERGFDRSTAPPTPENFQQPPQSQKLPADDAIPFSSLEDNESDGEILYGMGLYDTPENTHLDYHRSTVLSLLGPAESTTEPTGKGLKLEDAWDPPALDEDDDDENEDGSDDAEGEDQDDD